MTIYCIDDGGDGSQINTTQAAGTLDWTKADTSIANLIAYDAAAFTTSGNVIYFGSDTTQTQASALTIVGPTSGLPVILISADITQTTPTFATGTGEQIETTGATNDITLDGSFALYGMRLKSGRHLYWNNDSDESFATFGCRFLPGPAGSLWNQAASANARAVHAKTIIDLTQDGTTSRATAVINNSSSAAKVSYDDLSFVNPGYRTASVVVLGSAGKLDISGSDMSGFTGNGSTCEIIGTASGGSAVLNNIITVSGFTFLTTDAVYSSGEIMATNIGPADAPVSLYWNTYFGRVVGAADIYRTGGATVEGDATGWLVTTTASCAEGAPFYSPWMYGTVDSTGAKTFDLYITNDTADFDDDEVWLEVEYLATADEAQWSLASDQRATITTTAAAQTDDVTSTWNGSGPSFTYKQKLSAAATIGETGQYRARVAVGVASIASSRYFYLDPLVTVT